MKRIPKQKEEALKEKIEIQTLLVIAAMEKGDTTKKQICKSATIKMWELGRLLEGNKELYAMFKVRRKSLVDTAADNMTEIINDPDHPSHFAATKYVLQKYKSDLDSSLESHDVHDLEIEIPDNSKTKSKPVIIKFGNPNKK
jgi:hypothetical protein